MSRRDPADRFLAGVVRLLPAGRRDWGRAMRAELSGVEEPGRLRFALGCTRAVLTQAAVLRGLGYPLAIAGVVVWTSPIGYAPLRWGLVGLVSLLVALCWFGRRPGLVGPVGAGWPARLVRAGGYLLVGTMALGIVSSLGSAANPEEKASSGLPILTVVLTSYLLGFLAVTAHRSAATGRALITGAGAGVAATAIWTVLVLASPPIPASIGIALALTVLAMGTAGFARSGRLEQALLTGTTATLLIVIVLVLLASFGPASLIPDLAPAALTPADDLAQSRSEIEDPYVALMLIGCLIAAALGVASIATRRPAR